MTTTLKFNPFTKKLDYVGAGGGGGSGTVTSVSVISANGFAGTVANPTTTPAITLTTTVTGVLSGNGTAISGSPVTLHDVLVGGASNAITSVSPSTAGFVLTSNGVGADPSFQAITASGAVTTITGNTGGAISPTAGNINTLGTGSITIAGSGSSLVTQLTGLTNHAIQIGAGTATLTQLGAGTTGQVLQTNTAADPTWSTATYPSTTTINQILYSSANNTVAGLASANQGVLTTGTTGIPVITSLATNGQLIIGSTAGAPGAATLTAGTGITVTNASNSITLAVNGSVVGQTITGNSGGAISPSAGNWNIITANSTAKFVGSGSTETLDFAATTNVGIGSSFPSLGTGSSNTALGSGAMSGLTNAVSSVAVGTNALHAMTTGGANTAVGFNALAVCTTTSQGNTAIGNSTLPLLASGTGGNSAFGSGSGGNITSGTANLFFGSLSGSAYTGSNSSNISISAVVNAHEVAGNSNTLIIGGGTGTGSGQQNRTFISGIDGVNVGSVAKVVTMASDQLGTATITAGTGITVTAGANTITIATANTNTITSVTHAASPYTVLATDQFLACQTSGGVITLNLPNAPTTGRIIIIKDSNGAAATSHISVTTVGGTVTIDGQTTYTLATNYQSISVIFDGTNYEVF